MLRLLISATLVLAGASASGGAAARDPWPHKWTVSVYLCGGTGLGVEEHCPEGAATPSQIDAATVAVASDPRITEARLVGPEEGAEGFEHTAEWSNAPDKTDWSSFIAAKDLPYSIEAEAVAEVVPEVLIEDFEKIPAVTNVYVWPVMYWSGRADVRVQMCGPATEEDLSCAGRGAATGAELAAVADHLRALPGDPIVYEETPAHAR
ncbi:hypothetical protein GT755_02565 [Herbidospora sp. NEAU-GS84]|uniref:DUF3105 domain-containing protein n=1 Tax=Herbidospora solisilvae TaxID=2696284 RepID=A0A7C9J9M8_9ACTN|nr:hypothetical protein [Herbidospora solisilvae]NAS20564.1 hypothetical protein [Herbidospora solisilvae]